MGSYEVITMISWTYLDIQIIEDVSVSAPVVDKHDKVRVPHHRVSFQRTKHDEVSSLQNKCITA